ncbi:MAG TPA: helix-turn-helix transcriptional regulator [Spirochaetia bacterium]|nr:helix-turn-helix transcriptional regulator [Spirochaetia bacterium]
MNLRELKAKLMKDPAFQEAYEELQPEYQLIKALIRQRLEKHMTQSELAEKVGTRQSSIARLESGSYNPSFRFLKKVANALDARLEVTIVPKNQAN